MWIALHKTKMGQGRYKGSERATWRFHDDTIKNIKLKTLDQALDQFFDDLGIPKSKPKKKSMMTRKEVVEQIKKRQKKN